MDFRGRLPAFRPPGTLSPPSTATGGLVGIHQPLPPPVAYPGFPTFSFSACSFQEVPNPPADVRPTSDFPGLRTVLLKKRPSATSSEVRQDGRTGTVGAERAEARPMTSQRLELVRLSDATPMTSERRSIPGGSSRTVTSLAGRREVILSRRVEKQAVVGRARRTAPSPRREKQLQQQRRFEEAMRKTKSALQLHDDLHKAMSQNYLQREIDAKALMLRSPVPKPPTVVEAVTQSYLQREADTKTVALMSPEPESPSLEGDSKGDEEEALMSDRDLSFLFSIPEVFSSPSMDEEEHEDSLETIINSRLACLDGLQDI